MTYKIVLTQTALEDIRAAAVYISDTLMNNKAANKLLDSVNEKIGILAETPYMNPLVRDSFLAANGIRFQLINNYIAFYVIDENEKIVSVIRFQHSRRDWMSLLRSETDFS